MRYSESHKERTRLRVLGEAAAAERGLEDPLSESAAALERHAQVRRRSM